MQRIVERCFPWRYGDDYVSAIQATRPEGPSRGRLHQVPLPGMFRQMHFLSAAEARVAAWVIYQPDFIEGLENRPCMPIPGIAVLDGHPLLQGQTLPNSSGTVELSRRLGIFHPMVDDDRNITRRNEHAADFFPIVSDLLCLLRDGQTLRGVNLFVKKHRSDLNLDTDKAALFQLNEAYYAEAKIPTVKVCEDDLDPVVTNNLVRVIKLGVPPKTISNDVLGQTLNYMRERVFYSAPVTWETELYEMFGLLHESVFRIFHYGVLRRYLKVDLQRAVAMDKVHQPERRNFAAEFADRFLEKMP